jgi:acetyl esterase/lipase
MFVSDFHLGTRKRTSEKQSPCHRAGRRILIGGAVAAVVLLAQMASAESSVDISTGVTYVERVSGPLKADIYVPKGDGPFPGMIVVHGGAWAMGTREQLAGAALFLAEHGYTAVSIEYRLAPQDKWPAQIYDCAAAVRFMRTHAREYKIDPTRIGGYGYSAGGHLVALLGAIKGDELREPGVAADAPSARLQAVLAGGAPCDFRSLAPDSDRIAYWLGGTPAQKPDAYRDASPANYVTAESPPMFFFHGGSDELVPIRSPQAMVERLRDAGVTADFYTVQGAGHIPAALDPMAREHALQFADRVLKAKGADATTIAADKGGTGNTRADAAHEDAAARSSDAVEMSHAQ